MKSDEKKEQFLDFTLFIAEALGRNRKVYKSIDRIYFANKFIYYRLAKNSPLYKHQMIVEGDIFQEEYSKKALGIILSYKEQLTSDSLDFEKNNNQIIELIKKGWPHVYNYVMKSEEVDLGRFLTFTTRRKSDDEVNAETFIFFWLVTSSGKKMKNQEKDIKELFQIFKARLEFYNPSNKRRWCSKNFTPELRKDINTLRKRIADKYGDFDTYEKLQDNQDETVQKLLAQMEFIFDTERQGMATTLSNVKITRPDIDEILGVYLMTHNNKNAEEALKLYIPGLAIKGLLKNYIKVKQHFFENNKETMFLEMENSEEKIITLEKENYQLKNAKNNLKESLRTIKNNLGKIHMEEVQRLKNEIKDLQQQLKEEKEKEKELLALRELMFRLETKTKPEFENKEEIDTKKIKGVIIGGHEHWCNKMKELLPNVQFISSENFDIQLLRQNRYCYFVTDYLSHAIYYKAIAEARINDDLVIGYLSHSNENLIIKQMWEIMQKS